MRDKIKKEVKEELKKCEEWLMDKLNNKLQDYDFENSDMRPIDYIHDASHTLMLKRGPIDSLSEKRNKPSQG